MDQDFNMFAGDTKTIQVTVNDKGKAKSPMFIIMTLT